MKSPAYLLNLLSNVLKGVILSLAFQFPIGIDAQVVSPIQGGHYSIGIKNNRDMATPPSGIFILWYNAFVSGDSYYDRNGHKYESIRLDQINPNLKNITVDPEINAYATIPTIFWASSFEILGGAKYMAGVSLGNTNAKFSIITERPGIIIDTTYTRTSEDRVSGLTDLFVAPLGLSWEFNKMDITFLYGFYAPTGRYESGASDNIGLGFWTNQFQGYMYYYPVSDKSTALSAGLTYELNGKIKDIDVNPGNRLSLEWGVSQYLSNRFEVGIMGGHNWQISEDSGNDVYWDQKYLDKKNSLLFNAGYWLIEDNLFLNAKYGFDYGLKQRMKNNSFLLNIIFVPGQK
ncbi:SphA family protein [Marinigracilibium pacificum]|uniref:Transporter n=1 Tax=Marinigracilibium pacificum TaxID=2729599 RepID=A0A848IVW0_9BACT|nr:transporter [Marinigracilibium pacificum]NMM47381.1 transporter [Marinigracilibium pacificum]